MTTAIKWLNVITFVQWSDVLIANIQLPLTETHLWSLPTDTPCAMHISRRSRTSWGQHCASTAAPQYLGGRCMPPFEGAWPYRTEYSSCSPLRVSRGAHIHRTCHVDMHNAAIDSRFFKQSWKFRISYSHMGSKSKFRFIDMSFWQTIIRVFFVKCANIFIYNIVFILNETMHKLVKSCSAQS